MKKFIRIEEQSGNGSIIYKAMHCPRPSSNPNSQAFASPTAPQFTRWRLDALRSSSYSSSSWSPAGAAPPPPAGLPSGGSRRWRGAVGRSRSAWRRGRSWTWGRRWAGGCWRRRATSATARWTRTLRPARCPGRRTTTAARGRRPTPTSAAAPLSTDAAVDDGHGQAKSYDVVPLFPLGVLVEQLVCCVIAAVKNKYI